MRRLAKKVRLERAKAEAVAHVRQYGWKNLDDWIFTIAFHWGFEDDIPAQKLIADTVLKIIEEPIERQPENNIERVFGLAANNQRIR